MPTKGRTTGDGRNVIVLEKLRPRPKDPREALFNANFRRRLKEAREEMGWTQARMAKALGISEPQYKTFEYRVAFPLYLLRDLSTILDKPIFWLLTGR